MSLKPKKVEVLGMPLDEWKYESCLAHFGVGKDWATLYDIISREPGKGHATVLLRAAKEYYMVAQGKKVWGSVPLNDRMKRLYEKVGIPVAPEPDEAYRFQYASEVGRLENAQWDKLAGDAQDELDRIMDKHIEINQEFVENFLTWTEQVYNAFQNIYDLLEKEFGAIIEKAEELGILEIAENEDTENPPDLP